MKHLILYFTFINSVFSQGVVIVNTAKNSIPFATIQHGQLGNYCDENGKFELAIVKNKKVKIDSLHITAIGYEDKTIALKDVKDTIVLHKKEIMIPEIVLTDNKPLEKLSSGKIKKHHYFMLSSKFEVVSFINFKKEYANKRIKNIHFDILKDNSNQLQQNLYTVIRINIYTIKNDSTLVKQFSKIIKQQSTTKKIMEFDCTINKKIFITDKKFVMGIEFIGYTNNNGIFENKKESLKLAMTKGKSLLNQEDYFRVFYENSDKLIGFKSKGIDSYIALNFELE